MSLQQIGGNTLTASSETTNVSELELKKINSKDRQKYGEVLKIDDSEESEDLAVSMEADDPRLQEEEKKGGINRAKTQSDEDSDDIDADLDALEKSIAEDIDTDDDDQAAQPDFAPYDKSLKKKAGLGSRTSGKGLGAHTTLHSRHLLDQTDDYERDGVT